LSDPAFVNRGILAPERPIDKPSIDNVRNEASMNSVDATAKYERWVGRRAPLIAADLARKHDQMAAGPFEFLRATYYRWAQIWAETAGAVADQPVVLGVGDLHVENFGTWRDAEGRLVWGVNDFDEADRIPFTMDLTRLAASAVIAMRQHGMAVHAKSVAALVLDGYRDGVRAGGLPFVLEESHPALRAIAQARLKDAQAFWEKLAKLRAITERPPRPARRLLERLSPDGIEKVRVAHRVAGLGSLGRRRYTLIGHLAGGFVAREVKELLPAATVWARREKVRRIHYAEILECAVRCADPFLIQRGRWVGRRLSPANSRIELPSLRASADFEKVLHAMAVETANVHAGGRAKRLRAALRKLTAAKVDEAVGALVKAVDRDWKHWRSR
jgi:hypothetical protein